MVCGGACMGVMAREHERGLPRALWRRTSCILWRHPLRTLWDMPRALRQVA